MKPLLCLSWINFLDICSLVLRTWGQCKASITWLSWTWTHVPYYSHNSTGYSYVRFYVRELVSLMWWVVCVYLFVCILWIGGDGYGADEEVNLMKVVSCIIPPCVRKYIATLPFLHTHLLTIMYMQMACSGSILLSLHQRPACLQVWSLNLTTAKEGERLTVDRWFVK